MYLFSDKAPSHYVYYSSDRKEADLNRKIAAWEDLERALVECGISTKNWIKSPEELWREVAEGDCSLEVREGKLIRKVDVVRVRCFYTNTAGETFQLHEDRQEFKDNGVVRKRGFDYVAEKMIAGETVEEAAIRALQEELQIDTNRVKVIQQKEKDSTETHNSPSYSGIESTYTFSNFFVQIPEDQYRDSYREEQAEKITYFSWEKISK